MAVSALVQTGLAVAAGYGLACAYMIAFQRTFLYHPDKAHPWPEGSNLPEMAEVVLGTSDGLTLAAWWHPPRNGQPTVIYFHGNAGNRGWQEIKARPYIDAGFGLLIPDYRGYGGNMGRPSENGLRHDALAARAFVLAQGIDPARIVYHGESLGSGVAVWLASEQPPAGLILEAAFTSIPDVARRTYWWLPVRLATRDRFSSVRKIGAVTAPTLFLHGEQDTLVPVAQGRALYAASAAPDKRIETFPDALHANLYEHGAGAVVLNWLKDTLPCDPAAS